MGSSIMIERQKGVVVATLNRPDKLNALNKDLYDELDRLVDVLETDKAARVLIITGAGEKSFCVGADLKERQGMNEKNTLTRLEWVRSLLPRFEKLPIPVIAAMNGLALGGGLELALACDLRVLSATAQVGLPEVDLGIIPGSGGTQRLTRIIGLGRALEIVLMAKRVSAEEALHIGLVNEVVAQDKVLSTAKQWAEKITAAGPIAIRQAKLAIRSGLEGSLADGLLLETEAYKACLYSKDRLEGLKAFSEKRKPEYLGE